MIIKRIVRKAKKLLASFKEHIKDRRRKTRENRFVKNGCVMHGINGKTSVFLPNFKVDYIQNTIFNTKNYFEKENLDFVCKSWRDGVIATAIKERSVLDIGCNIGNHTLYYANECGAKSIYCFEPIAKTYDVLSKNVGLNKLETKTHLYQVGVGASSTKARIGHYDEKNIGGTTIEVANDGDIPIVSIDELNIQDIGLVKIDVEGFELNVLKGMTKTLEREHPFITIEIRDANFEEAYKILSNYGYQYVEIEEHRDYRDYNDYLFF